jgi:hypothetical protein
MNRSEWGISNSNPAPGVRSPRQKLASLNPSRVIHREYLDGRAPDRRHTLDHRSLEAEMIAPTVTPRIETTAQSRP